VFEGTPKQLLEAEDSLTGKYLRAREYLQKPAGRSRPEELH
jgi:excinuclease UvrABC ATPase subunit